MLNLPYEYSKKYYEILDVYEATREGKLVPLEKQFWEDVEAEVKKLKRDLILYSHDDSTYDHVLDAYTTLKNVVRKLIDARIYRIFMCVFKGLNPPTELSEPELRLYHDFKTLIENFRVELVPSLFAVEKKSDGGAECAVEG